MTIKRAALAAAMVAGAAIGTPAAAVTILLDFEGSSNQGTTSVVVGDFYNGGTDSGGTAGPDLGVSFTNANFDSFSKQSGTYGITSSIAYMAATPLTFSSDLAFTALSFDQYFFGAGNVLTVYSGANGTGSIVFQGTFGQNCTPNCTAQSQSIVLAGLGRSVTLEPNANGTGIDNLTLTAVPEPAAWAMMIGGVGTIGGALRAARRRRGALVAA